MKKVKVNIETVIKERLRLQSTQKNLEKDFDLHIVSLTTLKSIVPAIDQWPQDKRTAFIKLVGGPANYKITLKYLNSLTEKEAVAQ